MQTQARIENPAMTVPGAMQALQKLGKAAKSCGVPQTTLYLVVLRASQINGCSICADMHSRELRAVGEREERIFTLASWRETPYFTDAERAALGADRGRDPSRGPPRRRPGRGLGGGDPALRRAGTRRARPLDRVDQRLEPPECRYQADHRRVGRSVPRHRGERRPGDLRRTRPHPTGSVPDERERRADRPLPDRASARRGRALTRSAALRWVRGARRVARGRGRRRRRSAWLRRTRRPRRGWESRSSSPWWRRRSR